MSGLMVLSAVAFSEPPVDCARLENAYLASNFMPTGLPIARRPFCHWKTMNREDRLKRLRFRAWHRGTREADYVIGGYFDRLHQGWDDVSFDWFESLLNEEDADILGWVMGSIPVPAEWQGAMMERMQRIDYVEIPR